ncbi:hypothetical protein HN018_18885 [Lichenicola cladoniae]|uniref:Uncharacterized protein n=1 Tax=Lichenicola cladoniae TaxID=1484109 RepID=A0A6M8HTG8_9PROT|nr:hypothetical protein [Lichenicola cladoniae]NPD68214.1 hypothetical protein [Acetobacteraceae bacterium]QKE91824.1 hypothetical protein HN018_18885 [Lichenicola cladoniae]
MSFVPSFTVFLTVGVSVLNNLQKPLISQYQSLHSGQTVDEADIRARVDFIFNSLNTLHSTILSTATILYVILSIILSILTSVGIASLTDIKTPSFILFTDKAKIARDNKQKSLKLDTIVFFATFAVNVVAGVIAGVIFARFWS